MTIYFLFLQHRICAGPKIFYLTQIQTTMMAGRDGGVTRDGSTARQTAIVVQLGIISVRVEL